MFRLNRFDSGDRLLCALPLFNNLSLNAVIGIYDDVKGELARAYIVLREGMTATENETITFVRDKIANFKAPRMVEFVDAPPQGATGKILKRELRPSVLKKA